MGIHNIHILSEIQSSDLARRAEEALLVKLAQEHRSGLHPYGSMRRECPLCQAKE